MRNMLKFLSQKLLPVLCLFILCYAQSAQAQDIGLEVVHGSEHTSANNSGYLWVGNSNFGHLSLDYNDIQARIGTTPSNLFLNNWGGGIHLLGPQNNTGNLHVDINGLVYKNSNNRVGIGTANPVERFSVVDGNIAMNKIGARYLRFYDDSNLEGEIGHTNANNLRIANMALGGDIDFYASSSNNVVFKIDAPGNGRFYHNLRVGNSNDGNFWRLAVDGPSIMRGLTKIQNAELHIEQVSTNIANPNNGLKLTDEDANVQWRIMNSGDHLAFVVDNSRVSFIDGYGSYIVTSDSRLKEEVINLDGVLTKIDALRPVSYNYINTDARQRHIGFIAQEVQEIFPELVAESEDGFLGVAYDQFAAIAIQAIKEQQAEIESLKIQLEKFADLEARLSALETEAGN